MYQVLMYDGGVYRVKELYELIEDIGGFVIQKTQIQVQIIITFAIPEEDRPIIERKTRELGGKLADVPLAGTEIVVVGPTLGQAPHAPSHLRHRGEPASLWRHHRGHGPGPGKGQAHRADQRR